MPQDEISSQNLALALGLTRRRVSEVKAQDRLPMTATGKISLHGLLRRGWQACLDDGRAAAPDTGTIGDLRKTALALKVEAQRLALDESKGRLLDVTAANAAIDEIASTIRDALLNWPARVSGIIAAEMQADPHLVQTILQQHINDLLTEAADRFDPPNMGSGEPEVGAY